MIRLVQRKLIIPRGDTGEFTLPVQQDANMGDVGVFTIIDMRTQTKVYEKVIEVSNNLITVVFTHNDTVNLPVGRYVWDVKFYQNPVYADEKLVNGDEVDSYYAAYSLPECEIRQTGDNLLTSDDSPSSTLTPESLNVITAAINEATKSKNEAAESAAEASESAASAAASAETASEAAEEILANIDKAETAATNAAHSEANATQSATDAATSANAAAGSAQAAQTSATNASTSAGAAASSATSAASSANTAQGYVSQITGLSAQAQTLQPNESATATYNSSTGILTIGVPKGQTGDAFHIVKTYSSISAMNADYSGTDVAIGQFVMIVTVPEDPDNAKVYVKDTNAYEFVVDMSGAAGINGVGIDNIQKISTVGLVDTYRINYTDNTSTTYTVTNGSEYTVMIQNEEPNQEFNKIWIPLENGSQYTIPTMADIDTRLGSTVTPEMFGAIGDGTHDDTAAINQAFAAGSSIVFSAKNYRVTGPLFLYGYRNVNGNGATLQVRGVSVVILAGASSIGGAGNYWHGILEDLNIEVINGTYDQVIGLFNAKDCIVRNCTIDVSASATNVTNKLIGAVNNSNFVANSQGRRNLIIENNVLTYQEGYTDSRNNCECIGVTGATNLVIRNNTIYNARDDLGVHSGTNVLIEDNNITSMDARIFCSPSRKVTICNNRITYVSNQTNGMGIAVMRESANTTTYSKDVWIYGNYVDYTAAGSAANYGIRVNSVDTCHIFDNTLVTANGRENAQISIGHETLDGAVREPENIFIHDNKCAAIYAANIDCDTLHCYNNIVRDTLLLNTRMKANGNTITSNGRYLGPVQKTLRFFCNSISSSEFVPMSADGMDFIYCDKYTQLVNIHSAHLNTDATSGYYRVNIYVNDMTTRVGYMDFMASGAITTISSGLVDLALQPGDKVAATIKSASADPSSTAVELLLGAVEI